MQGVATVQTAEMDNLTFTDVSQLRIPAFSRLIYSLFEWKNKLDDGESARQERLSLYKSRIRGFKYDEVKKDHNFKVNFLGYLRYSGYLPVLIHPKDIEFIEAKWEAEYWSGMFVTVIGTVWFAGFHYPFWARTKLGGPALSLTRKVKRVGLLQDRKST